jgi:hypothetical protein
MLLPTVDDDSPHPIDRVVPWVRPGFARRPAWSFTLGNFDVNGELIRNVEERNFPSKNLWNRGLIIEKRMGEGRRTS